QNQYLVLAKFIESKTISKTSAVGKTENSDLPLKPKTNAVFCSRHSKRTPRIKRREIYRYNIKKEGVMLN
ncbi:unnamed protein product, partial [Hymenolepis diminuta]